MDAKAAHDAPSRDDGTIATPSVSSEGQPDSGGAPHGSSGRGRFHRIVGEMFRPKTLILFAVLAVIAYLTLTPIVYLLYGTFFPEGSFTLSGFQRAYSSAYDVSDMIRNSVTFAVGAAALSFTVGTSLAYLTARTNIGFRRVLILTGIIPIIIPGILYTISWILLASGEIGLINQVSEQIIGTPIVNIFSMGGMIWTEGTDTTPLVFLFMFAAFRSMDPSLEECALVCGATHRTMLRRVTLPLVRPAIAGALLLVTVKALEAFEVPALLGLPARIYVFTNQIFQALRSFPFDYAGAGALSISLVVISIIGVFAVNRLGSNASSFATVTGKGFRPQSLDLGAWKVPITALALTYFFIAAILPILILIYISFVPTLQQFSLESLTSFTLANYERLFDEFGLWRSVKNSVILSVSSATFVVLVTAIGAWFVVRTRAVGRQVIDHLTFLPLIVPGLVMGVAISFVYLRNPLPFSVYGTLVILFIAYATRYMPYGMRYAVPSLTQVSTELEESAHVSGASWFQTGWRVLLPLVMPGLLAGWIYILVHSIRELSSSILLYSPGNEVISIVIWELFEKGEFTAIAALGVLLVSFLILLVTIAWSLGMKLGVQRN